METLDASFEARGQDATDLGKRALGTAQATPLGDQEPEDNGRRFLVVEHQRRQPGPRAQAITTTHSGLAVDRDAEIVQRDDVAPDRPLADAQLTGGGSGVDHAQTLQQLQERKEAGGRPGDTAE
jgi:hypothetical protein